MAELKARLQGDLASAIKARESTRKDALRMALTAVTNEEVAGDVARELSDDEVRKVLTREVKRRREAAEAFDVGNRPERAAAERAEAEVLTDYLPRQLTEEELEELVVAAVAEVTEQLGAAPGQRQMGQVMKAANAKIAGRAEGARVAASVRAKLQG